MGRWTKNIFQTVKAKDTNTGKQIRMPYEIEENGKKYFLKITTKIEHHDFNHQRNIDEASYDYATGQRRKVIFRERKPEGWMFYYRERENQ